MVYILASAYGAFGPCADYECCVTRLMGVYACIYRYAS